MFIYDKVRIQMSSVNFFKLLFINTLSCIIFTGCSGEDGEDGKQGIQGDTGLNCWELNNEDTNGDGKIDILDCRGADGQPGQDGTLVAQKITINLDGLNLNPILSSLEIQVPELTQETLQNHTLLFYLEGDYGLGTFFFPIPGGYVKEYTNFDINVYEGRILLFLSLMDGSALSHWGDVEADFSKLHITLIENSSVQGVFEAHGVDVENYEQVMSFLNLD